MKKKSVWVHTLVKNEERYLWFTVMSVVDYVDKILLWDTGSSDKTVEIIQELIKLKGGKIDFREIGEVDIEGFTKVRQQMLDQTQSDWFLIVDGDEVWWQDSIRKVVEEINDRGDSFESIISPYYNIVGDIYHYQEESAGRYHIDDKSGHINIRAVNRDITGLHFEKPHGKQGLYDGSGVLIQERAREKREFIAAPYLHFTNMIRSLTRSKDLKVPKRDLKFKYELGIPFPTEFRYPEVFYQQYPKIVPLPWQKMSSYYFLRAIPETLLRKLRRQIRGSSKVGY